MSEELQLMLNDDGKFEKYDNTYDLTIHCESKEEQEEILNRLSQQWIPCSERLPKAFEYVNCTCHSLIDDRDDWVIETVYIPQPSDSPLSDWGNIPMLNEGNCEVVAWMHRDIPQPYKAEREVKDGRLDGRGTGKN